MARCSAPSVFPVEVTDRRGLSIKPGVYTLRLSFFPADGNHQGIAPQRDFLLLSLAADDTDLNATPNFADLAKMSAKVTGTNHPASLSVWKAEASQLPGSSRKATRIGCSTPRLATFPSASSSSALPRDSCAQNRDRQGSRSDLSPHPATIEATGGVGHEISVCARIWPALLLSSLRTIQFDVSGVYAEARSGEVYTCGCLFSSEMASGGREAILAWEIRDGEYRGTPLAGLTAVAVIVGTDNLGLTAANRRSVLYIDSASTPGQREAVVELLSRNYGQVLGEIIAVHAAPVSLQKDDGQTQCSRWRHCPVVLRDARCRRTPMPARTAGMSHSSRSRPRLFRRPCTTVSGGPAFNVSGGRASRASPRTPAISGWPTERRRDCQGH